MMVLLIALFALPAQADFWVTGNEYYAAATGGKKWDEGLEPKPLTKIDNSHFTLTMTVSQENYNKPIILRIAASDSNNWDTFNANAWGAKSGITDAITENGSNIQKWGTNNTNLQFTPTSAGTYILDISNVNWTNNTAFAKIIKQSSTTTASVIGFVTDANNWNSTGVELTDNGDGTASGQFTLYKEYFRIKVNDIQYGPAVNPTDITLGSAMDYTPQTSNSWKLATGTYNIVVDNNTKKVTVTAQASYDKYYVKYTKDNWSSYGSYEMKRQENGTYTYTLTDPKTSWQLAMQDNSKNDFWTNSEDNTYTGGTKSFTMEGTSSKNILFGDGLSGDYILTYDPSTKKLTISGGSTPTPSVSYRLKYTEDNWSNSKYSKPLTNGNGTYGYTIANPVEGLQFMVQRSTDNGKSYLDFCWPAADDKDYKGGDKTFTMSGAFGNNVTFGAGLTGDYTLTFTPNTTDPKQSTLTISGTAVTAFDEVYLRGSDPLSWSENKEAYMFTTEDGKIYTLSHVNLNSGVTMKVYKKGTWYGYDDKKVSGPVKKQDGSDNIELTKTLSDATITFDITDAENWKLTIVNPKPVYLRGDFTTTAWTDEPAYKFTTTDGKIYTLTGVNIDNGKKMKVYYDGKTYGYDENKVSTPLKDDGTNYHNMQLYADLIDATMTFDITDATNWKFIVDNNKDAYLRGDFTTKAWEKDEAYKFSTTDNQTYVLEHVNLAAGTLMKVYYGGTYYGHNSSKVSGPVSAENDNQSGYNMKLTEALKDATITFNMPSPYSADWTVSIVNGGAVEHKPYYFAGDLNRWFDKSFEGGSTGGIDAEIFEAEKDKWAFEYVGDVVGQTDKGWYKLDFKARKLGTLLGQFQIIDRGDWNNGAEVYSHNPKVTNYEDASGFARYINSPITRDMIKNGTVLTKDGTPGIVKGNGSNFHLDCNGVNNAVIYFLPGDNPKMIVRGEPTDYFVFYSADGKSGGNNAVSMEIVNGKPNEVNYYLPGVKNLKNYTKADASAEGPHMNIAPVDLTKINFLAENFEQTEPGFMNVFGASENVGDLTREQFVNMIKTNKKLPNGTSLDGRGEVYVIKIPNGFEYAAGTKFAVKFDKAFAASEIGSTSTIVANHLYFFNDELHVMLNVDNYEEGAKTENADVKLYYRVYGYDDAYNTVVVNSDGKTTTKLYNKGAVIGNTAESSTKDLGWVAYNHYGVMPDTFGAPAGNWHYATPSAESTAIYGLDPKFGNFFVQFKIVTGPKKSQATNGPAKVVDKEYTLYLPEKTLALNQEGFYNFNGQDLYVALEGGYTTTGVEDVFEDQIVEEGVDAEPIFFNLQGQRVVNPEKGMYIVVKGNKTYKVMIK